MKLKSFTSARRMAGLLLTATTLLAVTTHVMAQDRVVTGIRHRVTDDGGVEILIDTDGSGPEPTAFMTDDPPRLSLDFLNTRSELPRQRQPIERGIVRNVIAVTAGAQTRVVVELDQIASFDIQANGEQGHRVALTWIDQSLAAAEPVIFDREPVKGIEVTGIDFRRGADGEGRILIDISNPDVSFDSNVVGDSLELTLFDVTVPSTLIQELDVIDFATPVRFVDSQNVAGNALIRVQNGFEFSQTVYQVGNQIVVEISELEEETIEDLAINIEERQYTGDLISFNFQNISVNAILNVIGDFANLNLVVGNDVGGTLSLRLIDVPWDQALDIILETMGLEQRRNGNIIFIDTAANIRAREQARFQALAQMQSVAPLQTALIQVNYSSASDFAALLRETQGTDGGEDRGVLSPRGAVTVDERTNNLLVTDTADRLQAVRDLVVRLDQPVRQVSIESRIVTAEEDFAREIGTRFGITAANAGDDNNVFSFTGSAEGADALASTAQLNRIATGGAGPILTPGGAGTGFTGPALEDRFNVNLPTLESAFGSFGVSFLAANTLLDFELSALETENRGQIISSPRVITANQREAFIQQGTEVPFEQSTAAGATAVQFRDAVLELRVTPLITADNRIQLDLLITQNAVGEELATGVAIDTTEIQTSVLVNNGQTVVLGGIYAQQIIDAERRIPLLADIPGIGRFFRAENRSDERDQLLIFVTPRILAESLGAE